MSKCEACKHHSAEGGWFVCDNCKHDESLEDLFQLMTNADHIRRMTDEELAQWIWQIQKETVQYVVTTLGYPNKLDFPFDGAPDMIDWLKQPYKEGDHD